MSELRDYIHGLLDAYGNNEGAETSVQTATEVETETQPPEPSPRRKSPFKFLDSYTVDDADIFFGREVEIDQLYRAVFSHKLTVVFGASGTGKTSLVQCGLFSRLEPERILPVRIRFLSSPLDACRRELEKHADGIADAGTLTATVDRVALGHRKTVILLFDQFEELFILTPEKRRWEFLDQLQELVRSNVDVRVILNIREEYFAHLTELENHLPGVLHSKLWLRRLSGTAATDIIEKPCAVCDVAIDPEVIEAVLAELGREGRGIELPLMQVVMDALYKRALAADPARPSIRSSHVAEAGGLRNILSGFVEEQLQDLGEHARRILKTMVTTLGTKLPCSPAYVHVTVAQYGAEIHEAQVVETLRALVDRRIVVQDADTGLYELRHDILAAMVFEWMTGLEKELAEVRLALDNRHKEYLARGRAASALLDGPFLSYLAPYRDKLALQADPASFVEESLRTHTAAARRRRRTIGALALMVILALGSLSLFLWNAWQRADRNATEADRRTREAEAARRQAQKAQSQAETARTHAMIEKERATTRALIGEFHRLRASSRPVEAYAFLRAAAGRVTAGTDGVDLAIKTGVYPFADEPMAHTLVGHSDIVYSASWSHDGLRILTGSGDKTAKIWDAKSGKELRTLLGHDKWVSDASWSPDGDQILTGSGDSTAKIWDAKSGKALQTLRGHANNISSVAWSPDGKRVLTGSDDHTAKIWDAKSGKELRTFSAHAGVVFSVSWSADGKQIVTGSGDHTAKIWDTESGKELRTFSGHTDVVFTACWSPDGKKILTGSRDNTIRIWDTESGKELQKLSAKSKVVYSAAWSPTAERILIGYRDNTIKIWDAQSGTDLRTLTGHTGWVSSVAWSPDGKWALTSSADQTVRIWEVEIRKELNTLSGHGKMVYSASWFPDGKRIVTSSADHTARIWDAQSGKELRTLSGHSNFVNSAMPSPDGKRILTGARDFTARIWDAESGKELRTLSGHTNVVYSVSWSPDGERVLTGAWDNTAKIWDAQSGKEIRTLSGHTNVIFSVSWSPDGKKVLTGAWDNTAKIWDAESGKELRTLSGHTNWVSSVQWSPDGKRILTGAWDNTARIWDAESGKELRTLSGHANEVTSVSWSPDGKRALTGSRDNTAKIWDAQSGKEIQTFFGHTNVVSSVSWSPDGKRLLTGAFDNTAKIWDSTVRPLHELLQWTGVRSNLRVCIDSFMVVPVIPFPAPETVWAPEEACREPISSVPGI